MKHVFTRPQHQPWTKCSKKDLVLKDKSHQRFHLFFHSEACSWAYTMIHCLQYIVCITKSGASQSKSRNYGCQALVVNF